ncbi:uncharacterized protein LOC141906355 [Tubulanus polymorphus]|uniref:uncharacterized protein LOC141906355 n=1 Tax=Tubulanus polymorphus TaxID=672921 RepID=UPI003DA59D67
MRSRDPSESHSWTSLILQYIFVIRILTIGRWKYQEFIRQSSDVAKQQQQFLLNLVNEARNTEYGRKYKFAEISNVEQYRRQVPLSTYEDYRALIDRMMETDAGDLVVSGKAAMYGTASGTTGLNKYLAYSKDAWHKNMIYFRYMDRYIEYQHGITARIQLRKLLDVQVGSKPKLNRFGKQIGGILMLIGEQPFTIKPECIRGHPLEESVLMYILARVALQESELQFIQGSYPTVLVSFLKTIETRWSEICDDIETGALTDNLDIEPDIRRQIVRDLWPDPLRADILRAEFSKGFDKLLSRVWPGLQMVSQVTSGAFTYLSSVTKTKYLNDSVAMESVCYGATEGFHGVKIPEVPSGHYVPMLSLQFFEFIPRDERDKPEPITVLAHQLVEDEEYELVSSGLFGIYRYRTGDQVRVTGYWNQLPILLMQGRAGDLLNVLWEKVPETVFQSAIEGAIDELSDVELVNYTATENTHWQAITGEDNNDDKIRFYVLFIEIQGTSVLTTEQKMKFDESLTSKFVAYRSLRENGSISRMRVYQLKPGTFNQLKLLHLKLNPIANSNQFKQPRATREKTRLQLIKTNIIPS